jgi:hypothetical protein
MHQIRRFGIHAAILALLSIQVQAQNQLRHTDTVADARCVVIGLKIAGMVDASRQSAGTMLALYYIGRLEGRVPELEIEDLIVNEVQKMMPSEFDAETKRCGLGLSKKGLEITKIGNDVAERERRKLEQVAAPASPTK